MNNSTCLTKINDVIYIVDQIQGAVLNQACKSLNVFTLLPQFLCPLYFELMFFSSDYSTCHHFGEIPAKLEKVKSTNFN